MKVLRASILHAAWDLRQRRRDVLNDLTVVLLHFTSDFTVQLFVSGNKIAITCKLHEHLKRLCYEVMVNLRGTKIKF